MTCDFIFLRGFLIRTRFCDRRRRTKLLDPHGNNSYIHVHSLKFYRLRRSRRRYTVKYQRKPCKIDAAVLGVSRPLHTRYFSMERILVIMLEIPLEANLQFMCYIMEIARLFIPLRSKTDYTYTFLYTLPGLGPCLLNNEIIQGTAKSQVRPPLLKKKMYHSSVLS